MTIPITETKQDLENTKRERDWYAEGAKMFREIAASAAQPDEQRAARLQSYECVDQMRRRERFISKLEALIGSEEADDD